MNLDAGTEGHEHLPSLRDVTLFRGGLVCKAHRLLYDSTLGLRVIKKKKMSPWGKVAGLGTRD